MNRGFRAPDSKMPGPLHHRPGMKLGNIMKEKDEELSLFLELRKRERERTNMLLRNTDEFDPSLASKSGSSPIFKVASATASRKVGSDDFLNSDSEKNDYDWLLTPPGTPLFPSLEKESHGCPVGQFGTPKARPTVLKSRLSVPQSETSPRGNLLSRQPISTSALNTSSTSLRRPTSTAITSLAISRPSPSTSSAASRPSVTTSSTASRPSTPTGRSTLPVASKPSRASTPTSRATLPSTKPLATSGRPSTPARSSTPTARPTLPASKSSSRPSTPTRRPSTPSAVCSNPGPPGRTTSVTKSSTISRNSAPSRGTSPTVRSRPWQPSEMPGFSLDAPPNLRTSMPERPVSASRGRPGGPSALRSGSSEIGSNGKPRRQSCSPTGLRGRVPNTGNLSNGSLTTSSRLHSDNGDNVSPVVIGSKMVERVMNLRRLAPPRQDNLRSSPNNPLGKSASPDSTGFGRTLSKKSLDMALRHMDIRRSIPGSLRPLMTNIPASSMYSVRSGPARSRPISISDSPLATSSNASSEQSVSNGNLCLDVSEVEDDDLGSEKGFRSFPAGLSGRRGIGSTNWLVSSEVGENHV